MGEKCFCNHIKNFHICDLPNLENINIKKESLPNIKLLAICNNQLLKTIDIEDGACFFNLGELDNHSNLVFVKEVRIESEHYYSITIVDNPNLEELETARYSFIFTALLRLISNC